MKTIFRFLVIVQLLSCPLLYAEGKIEWRPWSDDIFEKAKAEHKLVLLDLGAGWCHWCHVMDEVTYADGNVREALAKGYIAVRVDQDSRPDLSNRYEDYGWPATIIFKQDGSELAKRQGYIPPKPMASMLEAFINDPTPGPSVTEEPVVKSSAESSLVADQRKTLRADFIAGYDKERGGWGDVHKYLNWDAIEYCLAEGRAGDAEMAAMARRTLTSGRTLIDPVWGGVYQYSTDGDWDHPHFEKIIPFQAENLRVFSIAAAQWHEPRWLADAEKIRGYLKEFMTSPEGTFFTSQDADLVAGEHSGEYFALDDAGRRMLGIPRIDKHVYSRENGLVITGLASLYAAGGDATCLADAVKAAEWIMANRALPGGGFRHDGKDEAGPYLVDTLAMGRAFLSLYTVTAEGKWLARAEEAAGFIEANFHSDHGYVSARAIPGAPFPPKAQVDENIAIVRLTALLAAHTGKEEQLKMAEHAMRYLASDAVVERQGITGSGILLADRELRAEPAHVTIVGAKKDPVARQLFGAALREAPPSSRIEWLDRSEGALPRSDVEYPESGGTQAYICSNGACSLPLNSVDQVVRKLRR